MSNLNILIPYDSEHWPKATMEGVSLAPGVVRT
jgi:hypothetical protein